MPDPITPCPSDHAFAQWLAGDVAADTRAQLLRHLDGCAACRQVCAALAPQEATAMVSDGATRFVLGEELVRGGMGRILRAQDRVLGRAVALKLPHAQAGAQARFTREVELLARLAHPAIVTVLDAGRIDAETPYLAMPLLVGRTLAAEVAAGRRGRALLVTLVPALSAIAYAHAQGVVHRDLSPDNIFVGAFAECTVIDWGLAAVVGEAAANLGSGTPGYASPSQLAGAAPNPTDDVHALGGLLRFVFTGRHRADPRDRRGLPAELRSIIAGAVNGRYPTARELLADVERYLAGTAVALHHYTWRQRSGRWLRAHRTAATAGLSAVGVAVVLGGWSVARIVGERDRAQAAELASRRAREQSGRLSSFLLEEVHQSVAELGRLGLAEQFLAGLEPVVPGRAPLTPTEVTDPLAIDEAAQFVLLRHLMADVALAQKAWPRALAYLAPLDALLASLPSDAGRVDDLRCRTATRRAEALQAQGESALAHQALEACLQAAGTRGGWQNEAPRYDVAQAAAHAQIMLGDLARDRGDPQAARAAYLAAEARLEGPDLPAGPAQTQRLLTRAAFANRLGTLAYRQRRLDDAEADFRRAIGWARAAATDREAQASAQWLVAETQLTLSTLLGEREGEAARAERQQLVAATARLAEPLYVADPSNEARATFMTILWRAQAETGPRADAPRLFERIIEVSRRLTEMAPRSPTAARDLAIDLLAYARWLADSEELAHQAQVRRLCDEGIAVMRQRAVLLASTPGHDGAAMTAAALVQCAEDESAMRQLDVARSHLQEAQALTLDAARAGDPTALQWHAFALALYLDLTPSARAAGAKDLTWVWHALPADGKADLRAAVRDVVPWWTPPSDSEKK